MKNITVKASRRRPLELTTGQQQQNSIRVSNDNSSTITCPSHSPSNVISLCRALRFSKSRCKAHFRNALLTLTSVLIILSLFDRSYAVPTTDRRSESSSGAPQLSLEGLLSNPNLEDAIQRLTAAWHSANSLDTPTKQILISNLISSSSSPSSSSSSNSSTATPTDHHSRARRSLSPTQALDNSSSDESYGANCTKCRDKDEARALRIEAIKAGILSKLGFERAPNVSAKSLPKIPPISHFLDRYQISGNIEQNGFKGKHGENEKLFNSYRKRHANPDYFGPLKLEQDSIVDEYFVSAERSIVFAQKGK